ncbi:MULTISPECIES: MurR/RpiR family transcriptional regulator [Rhizobium]|uniref:MurR/RpiR family transcriptional regulator n=1 Tax=Rhizobium TaxID=379 RepID=UPI0016227393|nr:MULTISPECIES: MurR/RpiR family transcriptional regulator [Rhizobium]MBB6304964.1 DNA-binding MurR/RpiR family transcriptional regulator [Rhizobium leucaenae]MDK4743228.1 MurR/RpiR family transcriptional regulator [Rhizobium sp. CNPSo 3464]
MDFPTTSLIKNSYERFPRQMKVAARWLVDHPTEVALLSMREQARRARVPPATLTRLAKRLGFDGFDKLKEGFADSIRERPECFAGSGEELLARGEIGGDGVLICDTVDALQAHLSRFAQPSAIAALAAAADLIAEAKQILCIGRRSSFPVAYLMHHVGSLLGSPTTLIDGMGGSSDDALRSVGPEDILVAVTVSPYTRFTIQAAEFAVSRGAKLVALTDSELSPIAKISKVVIRVRTEVPSFIHTMTPALAAVECLMELVAARRGSCALRALADHEEQVVEFDTYVLKSGVGPNSHE